MNTSWSRYGDRELEFSKSVPRRKLPGLNVFVCVSLQEELAFVFEMLQQFEDALVQYDELDALFTQYVLNFGAGGELSPFVLRSCHRKKHFLFPRLKDSVLVELVPFCSQTQRTGWAHSVPQCVPGAACCFGGPLTWRRGMASSVGRPAYWT